MRIDSFQNPKIKEFLRLQSKSRDRRITKKFVVEGINENRLAMEANYIPSHFFICEQFYNPEHFQSLNAEVFFVSESLYTKMAYRKQYGGILGVYSDPNNYQLPNKISDSAIFIILEGIEKPGNLGAILRSCDAVLCDGVILIDPEVDFFNPNVIRSSVGSVFTNSLYRSSFNDLIFWANQNQISIWVTHLHHQSISLYDERIPNKIAFVFGEENMGISERWLSYANQIVKLPMKGKVDSLNLSNAVAVSLYENLRQKFH